MPNILTILQIFVAAVIIGLVLLQAQGSGLGSTWGGGGETYHTKRGVEKVIFYLTIFAVFCFGLLSLVALML